MVAYTKRWTDMDTDELLTWESEVTERLQNARNEVNNQEQSLKAIQAELKRRQIEAVWVANPGERLQVGDRLLITQEAHDNKIGDISHFSNIWPLNSVVSVRDISTTGRISFTNENGSSTYIDLDIARRMRQAWLAQREEAQS
jgi:hypothetical protein